jgi:hypothetical protein
MEKQEVPMIRSTFQTVLVVSFLCFMAGCSVDRAQIISHPSSAKPGDTITVLFSDIYLIISSTPTSTQSYIRDSLHAGYGLPAGWSVLSSDYYIATGIRMNQMASLVSDPSRVMALIQDSLALYTARKTAMTKDNGWSAYFTGKTFTAHSVANNDSVRVPANNVGQWLAYSSRINLSVPTGTKMDTGVALASLPIDSATLGTISSLYGTDSIWVKAIPIVCFAQIVAGRTEGIDTLLYFTKTGPKPSTAISFIPNYDKGDMTYVPITITPKNAVLQPFAGHTGNALLQVSPATITSGSRIAMSIGAAGPWRLSIFDAAGKNVRSFSAANASPALNQIIWDGTTETGSILHTGTYCIKLESAGKMASQLLHIIK